MAATITARRFITVLGRGTAESIQPYLYEGAALVKTGVTDRGFSAVVQVVVTAEQAGGIHKVDGVVTSLTQQQADRLSSGLYGVRISEEYPSGE